MSISSPEEKIVTFLNKRGQNAIQQQQVITYLIATSLAILGMSLHLFNVLGARMPFLRLLSIVVMFVCAVTFVLWLFHKVSVKKALTFTAIVVQAVQTAKIVFISIAMSGSYNYLIVMNGIISMMLMVLLAISYLRLATLIVGAVNAATLIFAGYYVNHVVLLQFVILLIFFIIFFFFMADLMYRNVKRMQEENTQYHSDEQRLLQTLRLNRKEIRAYIEMCRNDNSDELDTDRLFDMLSEKAQRNVINAVERKKASDADKNNDILNAIPDLTPMELEVARQVLRGMKLSQIIAITGKSETNINVVRSRIRKKLGLAPGEDLRTALLEKIGKSNNM